jgi:hypothetical protein
MSFAFTDIVREQSAGRRGFRPVRALHVARGPIYSAHSPLRNRRFDELTRCDPGFELARRVHPARFRRAAKEDSAEICSRPSDGMDPDQV